MQRTPCTDVLTRQTCARLGLRTHFCNTATAPSVRPSPWLLCARCLLPVSACGTAECTFVDNTPAWSYMINGYSSSAPMAEMGNLFHRAIMIAVLGIDCWIEWVNSDANIADLPSR